MAYSARVLPGLKLILCCYIHSLRWLRHTVDAFGVDLHQYLPSFSTQATVRHRICYKHCNRVSQKQVSLRQFQGYGGRKK
jgi:hypothetical protein